MMTQLNYKEMLDNLPVPVGLFTIKGDLLYLNREFISTYGYEFDEISSIDKWLPKACPDQAYREFVSKLWHNNIEIVKNRSTADITGREFKITCKNNTVKDVEVSFKRMDGNIIFTLRDVTVKSNIINELENQRNFSEKLINNFPGIFFMFNHEMKMILWNKKLEKLSGYSHQELNNMHISAFQDESDRGEKKRALQKLKSLKTGTLETTLLKKDGSRIPVLYNGFMIEFHGLEYLVAVGLDYTEQKNTKEELFRQQSFSNKLLDVIPGIFFLYESKNGVPRLIKWNKNHELNLGYSEKELFKKKASDFFPMDKLDMLLSSFASLNKFEEVNQETEVKTKNGQLTPYFFRAKSLLLNDTKYFIGVALDIKDIKKKERALKQSEENLKLIFNTTSDAIFIFNYNFKILKANKSFLKIIGLNEHELPETNIFDFILDANAKDIIKGRILLMEKGIYRNYTYTIRNKSNKIFPVEIRGQLIAYEGEPAILVSFNDISERKKLEKEIYYASVNAEEQERGRLAKDLHDGLGPLLSTCRIYIHNIKHSDECEKPDLLKNLEELINEAITGIKEISNNLSPHILNNHNLVQALKNFICKIDGKNGIRVEFNCEISVCFNEFVEITLYRVITELINNTIKYADAGIIRIQLKENNSKFIVEYSDNGKGFNYNETLKNNKGFGLLNINSRLNSIGADLNYYSKPGSGIRVKITLNINNKHDQYHHC